MLQNRFTAPRKCLEKYSVDAILFLDLSNIRYLSGFSGSDGALIVRMQENCFLTDSRYTVQAGLEVTGCRTVEYRNKLDGVADYLRQTMTGRVGFDAGHTTYATFSVLANALPAVEFVPITEDLDSLRIIKDKDELGHLFHTARIASESLTQVIAAVSPGMTERDLALELEITMLRNGADDKAFDFIVASGERGALPHGRATSKVLQSGELITIDYGAVCNGYHSDETVTVALGAVDSRQREIYTIVKDAHDRALEAVKPGISLKRLDELARNHIDQKGYGNYFGHGLGHGVGLEVHEKPVVSQRSEGIVEEGMVFTIEPGIYIPGWGGVRIEDTVSVTADGCSLLTMVPKELMIL